MRQRRHVLQVSTFPFLAVLLCTMGSLILLLLAIDRRARVVARAKALRAAALVAAEDAQAQARRQAELERRQQTLHARLQAQDEDLSAQIQAANQKSAAAAADLQREQAQDRELQKNFQAESERLAQEQLTIQARQAEAAQTVAKSQKAQRELARLNGDLTQLERALADLKEARKRDTHKYSLVPYRGRRGDNRRPLYVECTDGEVIFHPDRARIAGLQLTLGSIRTEVEQRLARKRAAATTTTEKNETPYLLLLIRPNGVRTYYRVLSALEGLKIDFGYEFVDADWVLDFPEKEDANPQPWMIADETPGALPPAPRTVAPKSPARSAGGHALQVLGEPAVIGGEGTGGNSGQMRSERSGVPATGVAGSALPTQGNAPVGVRLGASVGVPSEPSASALFVPGIAGSSRRGGGGIGQAAPGNLASSLSNAGRIDTPPALPNPPDGLSIRPTANGNGGPGFASTGSSPVASPANAAMPVTAGTGLTNSPGSGAGFPGSPTSLDGRKQSGSSESTPAGINAGQFSAGTNLASGTASTGGPPAAPSTQSVEPGAAGAASPEARSPIAIGGPQVPFTGSAGKAPIGGTSGGGEPRSDESTSEGRPILPPVLPSRSPPRPAPPERPRVVGGRDWVVSLDCTADGVRIYPGGRRIAAGDLNGTAQGTNSLFQAVQSLITRRQAMVRPGEPPYRPVIRFLVHPDGLRTYYLAYPALESLQVSMIRENVRPGKKDDP